MQRIEEVYFRYPERTESLNHELGKQVRLIMETLHVMSGFEPVIRDVLKHLKLTKFAPVGFYSGWCWSVSENSCVKVSDADCSKIDEVPIWIDFQDDEPTTSCWIKPRQPESAEPGYLENERITVFLNPAYLRMFYQKAKPERFDSASLFPDNATELALSAELYGKDPIPYLYGALKHEFVHAFHSWHYVARDLLRDMKNQSSVYELENFPPEIASRFGGTTFEKMRNLLYLLAPTEEQARLNGAAGYLSGMSEDEFESLLSNGFKKRGIEPDFGNKRAVTSVVQTETVYFTQLDALKDDVDVVDRMYQAQNYYFVVRLGYLLDYFNLFRTKPRIGKDAVLRFSLQKRDEVESVCGQVVNWLFGQTARFKKRLDDIVFAELERRELLK